MKNLLLLIINLLLSINVVLAQLENGSFEFDGLTRNYTVFLPQNFQPNMPVVINLHADNMSIESWMGYTMMNNVADSAGFIVVYPAGINETWNWGDQISQRDDVGFISELIDTLEPQYNIDMTRIYCAGASSGGLMTYRLLGEIGYRFAAAALVAGGLTDLAPNWKPSQFSPILIIHGTADANVPYDGGFSIWSVEESLNYWIRHNNCSLKADTLLLPDIDTTDNCTIEKISWMNCSDNSSIIHFKVIDGAHHWPCGNVDFMSYDGNFNNDINSSAEMWKFFQNYTNPLLNMAYTVSMEVNLSKKYLTQADTLTVNAHLTNPENHPTTVYAVVAGDEKMAQDSFELFDDGLHGDGDASDGLLSGRRLLSNLSEDMYTVELYTEDLTEGTTHFLKSTNRFTTKGPVNFERLEFTTNDSIPNPGDRIKFSLVLRNSGITDTVYNVDVNMIINDTTIQNTTTGKPKFGDIPPGESVISTSRDFALSFGDSSAVGQYEVGLEIKSNNELFWYDTFTIDVLTGIEDEGFILPKKFILEQNYPNPYNPSTKIKYSIPSTQTGYISHVQLVIYDILGREVTRLVNQKQKPGNYEVEFSAKGELGSNGDGSSLSRRITSGIYFYRLQAGEYAETKKMIILK